MAIALITGASGLIGSEAVRFFGARGLQPIGIDNNMRAYFFGDAASTADTTTNLCADIPNYISHAVDIRDRTALGQIFSDLGGDISLVLHTAAQPSHDWAAKEPLTDFSVNATGTLNLLELTRQYAPKAVFIFTSTNKVYGDTPNRLPLVEQATRWEIDPTHAYAEHGIDEQMSIDHSTHSLFGVSKISADLLVQEYGRYFGMHTACFRGGCLTGPNHAGAQLHGFLSYLIQAALTDTHYTILGYQGKQVRDNIHSFDLVNMFWNFYQHPRSAAVYNAGGSRHSNCSMLEVIALCEEIMGRRMRWSYQDTPRVGDHIWWISDIRKFQHDHPEWSYRYDLRSIVEEMMTQMDRKLSNG